MPALGLTIIDDAVQSANAWINQLNGRLGWEHEQRAYRLLRVVLHVIRDHLGVDEAAQFGAQLPTLIKGIYYEGWNPSETPVKMRDPDVFVAAVQEAFTPDPLGDAPEAIAAVIGLLRDHVSEGEMAQVESGFTTEIRSLFD